MSAVQELESLRARLVGCPRLERRSLGRWLTRVARNARAGRPVDRSLARLHRAVEEGERLHEARSAPLEHPLAYPPELPVSAHAAALREAIREHQVLVVCGETGSGKTTQLPKLCLEAGRGLDGLIGHTQPRRVAAQSVAERIAEETGGKPGGLVGWQVRFQKTQDRGTRIKVMTDGILLAETQDDPDLDRYDTLIIDEAHERSLNIDFLLGYLRRLTRRRADLRVVITSATIDAQRFSEHFGNCPVFEVSGRAHPVEVAYRPPAELGFPDADVTSGPVLEAAIRELEPWPGLQDVLVFLPGEREIQDALEHLQGALGESWECLPLYARLPGPQQRRIFAPGERRRVILATNVAETSLTVPRITAVLDTGLARVSRFSARARIQRLPVEQVSRASARQRAGRCGRIAPGRCLRLYPESVFEESPAYTQPELLRSNLAGVVLRMLALGLGPVEEFPFLDPPSPRLVDEGWATLQELGAVDRTRALTDVGRRLARLPVDPRLGRMLVESIDERVLPEVLVIASALSTQDPRVRPPGLESAADLAHAVWFDQKSDFAGLLRIWFDHQERHRADGASAARRWCGERFLSPVRMREWFEVHRQLRETVREVFEVRVPDVRGPGMADGRWGAIHRSILAGLVSNLGRRTEERTYELVNGAEFRVHPGSGLARGDAPWVVVAEITETTRRYGRVAAKVRGDWVERVAPHLVRREYEDPHYLEDSGQVAAFERVHFGQLVVVPRRRVPFGPIDPVVARDVFIQEALVEEKLRGRAPFLARNIQLRRRIEALEERGRRHDLLAPSEQRFQFYDQRVPAEVHSAPSFERWRASVERRDPTCLVMTEADLMRDPGRGVDAEQFPDTLDPDGAGLRLDYRHAPGGQGDGVTVEVDLPALVQLDVARLHWLVPGLLAEKVEVLVRSLPKRVRTRFTPIATTAQSIADSLEFGAGDLLEVLAARLGSVGGIEVRPDDFDLERLPAHLSMVIRVLGPDGTELARGRDPRALLASLGDQADQAFDALVAPLAEGLNDGVGDGLPEEPLPCSVSVPGVRGRLEAWVALAPEPGGGVGLHAEESAARAAHREGITRRLAEACGSSLSGHLDWLLEGRELEARATEAGLEGAVRPLVESLVAEACFLHGVDSWGLRGRDRFEACLDAGLGDLSERAESVLDVLEELVARTAGLRARFAGPCPESWRPVVEGLRREFEVLSPRRLQERPWARLARTPRLLEVLSLRLDRIEEKGVERELRDREVLAPWRARLGRARDCLAGTPVLEAYELQLEVFGTHQVAPSLAPAGAGSLRRLGAAWNAVCAEDPRLEPVR